MSGQTQTAPSTPFAAEGRLQLFALMSRLSWFGVPRAQRLAVFTLTEAIPGLVGWRELFGWLALPALTLLLLEQVLAHTRWRRLP